jgi:hypothetical protein
MKLAQSPHIPAQGKRPGWTDLGWLAAYSVRGLYELARARVIFTRLEARAIPKRNRKAKENATASPTPDALARIAYVLPRLSDRLPWRSDCMVQAIAGQNWLSSLGAAGEIQIGVENPKDGRFGAHAWLMLEGEVVTGGEIDRYEVLLADSRLDCDSRAEGSVNKHD